MNQQVKKKMSPEEMSEEDKQSNLPEGRRVSKSSKSKSSRETLYLKRKQLLQEMQSNEELRPISVREQIESIKSPTSTSLNEDDWGSKEKRKRSSPWILWMILGLVVPVILVGLMLVSARNRGVSQEGGSGSGLDFDVLSGNSQVEPQDWFVENSRSALSNSLETFELLNEEDLSVEQIAGVVRSPEQAEKLVSLKEAGKWAAFDMRDPTSLKWNFGASGEVGFMTIAGLRRDFHDFRAYFVQEEGETLLDVEATAALSDIPINELAGETLTGAVLLRCWVAKEPHFDSRSDGELFSWYQIISPDQVDFVWAYCATGGPLDEALRKEMNYGRLIGERKKQFRATIKVGNAKGFNKDEFLFEELLANEWVLPNVQ